MITFRLVWLPTIILQALVEHLPKIAELIILEKLERRQALCPSDKNPPNSVLPTTNFAVGYFSFSSKSSCSVVGLIQVVFCPLINKLFGLAAPLS